MRLAAIYCLILACTAAAALADKPRPRRHLHKIKELIVNKLFSSSKPNCNHADPPLGTKFFEIPGFNNVVIKAVPKGSNPEPAPVYEKLPPNSNIGIVGSYLGTDTLNETYNALLGVKNLLTSGILSGKPEVLQEVGLVPSKVQAIAKSVKPCLAPSFSPLALKPVRVSVNPLFPTQYSYKLVNQDGSLTTYTSSLDLENGVKVTEDGKTLPFIVDRVRNIPVRLPVPVSPEVSKIIVSEAVHPATYSYQQIYQDGRMTSYMGLPPLISRPGPVVVTETGARMPPLPVFLMDRIEKVAASASYPRTPFMPVAPKPVAINAAVVGEGYMPGPAGYSYSQMDINGGITTDSTSGVNQASVLVTEMGARMPPPPVCLMDRIEKVAASASYPRAPFMALAPKPVAINAAEVGEGYVPGPAGYSYSQMDINGGITTHSTSGVNKASVLVTETGARMPPPPVFPMDRIEKVAASASHPRAPFMAVAPKPEAINASVVGEDYVPGPVGYSYSQMDINGGMTTHSTSGVNEASVLVTENEVPTAPLNVPSLPEENPFRVPAGYETYSSIQIQGGEKTPFDGFGVPEPVNVIEHKPISVSPGIPFPPNLFSYKQIGDGKMTTYTGSGTFEESLGASPAVIVHEMGHPIPPPHITDRIEKVAAGAKYNRPPYLTMPIAVPVPTGFVSVPSVHTSLPQRPVKIPTPGMNSFIYKQVHNDGYVTSYGSDGLSSNEGKTQLPPPADMAMPFPQGNVRVFESPMYSGPFPMNLINSNAVKPSTPVSGSYSYKSVNSNFQGSHPPVGPIDGPIVDTFAPPPPTSMPAHIQGCIDPDISNAAVLVESPLAPIPLRYSYKQISHSNPDPFLVVNVEDPVRGVKNVNMRLGQNNQGYSSLPSLTPPATVNVVEPTGFLQPAPFLSAPIMKMPVPQRPIENSPPSSFSYKQVTNQEYQTQAPPQKSAVNIVENNPSAFVPMSNIPMPQASNESPPPSSFSYKQVNSQAYQPLSSPQPTINMEHRPSGPSVPPPMINMRMPEVQKENAPSSLSYKQMTSQGVYEYSDEFPTGIKTNLPPNAMNPLENPSRKVYVEQKPLPNPTSPTPMPENPILSPSKPTPILNGQDSVANNPIIVLDSNTDSSFSFKSANSHGSKITVKDDGYNSIAEQVEEVPKTEAVSHVPTILPLATVDDLVASVLKESATTLAPEETTPVKHRGDIPDGE